MVWCNLVMVSCNLATVWCNLVMVLCNLATVWYKLVTVDHMQIHPGGHGCLAVPSDDHSCWRHSEITQAALLHSTTQCSSLFQTVFM